MAMRTVVWMAVSAACALVAAAPAYASPVWLGPQPISGTSYTEYPPHQAAA
jgi:hypothetical protein